jgi:biopolymer transport protein ExbD
MREKRRDLGEETEANTTPMIDVVFLLIIFFLCIDFRVLEAKLPAFLPKDRGTSDRQQEPREALHVCIVCTERGTEVARRSDAPDGESSYALLGHRIEWEVGPKRLTALPGVVAELERIRHDPSKLQRDDTGRMRPMDVVIRPGRSTTYGDVARTLDAVRKAGFEDISFGPGAGSGG